MAKRFTETTKWQDPWFRKLEPEHKAVWEYLRDSVDAAGFWKKDYELASFLIGVEVVESLILDAFNDGKERVKDHGTHLELTDFIFFQYGVLSEACKAHKHVIDLVEKYKNKGFGYPIQRVKDKDIDKDKDKEKGLLGEKPENRISLDGWFEELWLKYPNKDGKKHAKRHFQSSVKTGEDYARISKALENYLGSKRVKEGFVKNASTWFNGWTDWEFYTEPERSGNGEKSGVEKLRELRAKSVS